MYSQTSQGAALCKAVSLAGPNGDVPALAPGENNKSSWAASLPAGLPGSCPAKNRVGGKFDSESMQDWHGFASLCIHLSRLCSWNSSSAHETSLTSGLHPLVFKDLGERTLAAAAGLQVSLHHVELADVFREILPDVFQQRITGLRCTLRMPNLSNKNL